MSGFTLQTKTSHPSITTKEEAKTSVYIKHRLTSLAFIMIMTGGGGFIFLKTDFITDRNDRCKVV